MVLLTWLALVAEEPEAALAALPQIPEPHAADETGLTALHLAILWGHQALALALMEAGDAAALKGALKAKTKAWVNRLPSGRLSRPDGGWFYRPETTELLPAGVALDKGATPLHAAASVGDTVLTQALLARKVRATKDGVGATPLHLAALGGHRDCARLLLNAKSAQATGTKTRKSLRFYDAGTTPLMAALESGSWGLAQEMLALGADPAARTKFGCSALFFAARGGALDAVNGLLALGLDATEQGVYSNDPLEEAVRYGHREVVARLLALGAPPVQPGGKHAPLLLAFKGGDEAMVETLVAGGVPSLPDHGPLFFAGVNDWLSLGNYLDKGGDPNRIERGETPLLRAAADGHVQVTRLLLAAGADPNAAGARGFPLQWALSNRKDAVVELLLGAGPDCSHADAHGNQVLWPTLREYGEERLDWLARMIELGANPHRQSRGGSTTMAAAVEMGLEQAAALFRRVPVPGDANAAAYVEVGVSKVLQNAQLGQDWKKLHAALWDELVPPRGPAPSLQGELVRCIGSLTDEAYRNGNINWGPQHVEMLGFLSQHLLADPAGGKELAVALRKLGHHRSIDTSGDGSPHYQVSEAVVRWCLARPTLLPRTTAAQGA